MPLTRHLYENDEVIAALQLCLRGYHGYTTRALFWAWELIFSDEPGTALSTIHTTWLAYGGGIDPTLMKLNPTEIDEWISLVLRTNEAIHRARTHTTHRFLSATAASSTRPHRQPPPQPSAALFKQTSQQSQQQQQPVKAPAAFQAAMANETLDRADGLAWWSALEHAIRAASCTDACWLLQAAQPTLSADIIWLALQTTVPADVAQFIPSIHAAIDQYDPVQHTMAQATIVLLACMTSEERMVAVTPPPLNLFAYRRDWVTWTEQLGRRGARKYSIPADALHTGTTRGSMSFKYTNIGDVRDPVPILGEATMWWRKQLLAHKIEVDEKDDTVAFPEDEVLEQFYGRHFPDDIPDEWSKGDQEKSHGRGCAEKVLPHPAPLPPIREEPLDYDEWATGMRLTP
jgi:hypothetical protein